MSEPRHIPRERFPQLPDWPPPREDPPEEPSETFAKKQS